MDTVMWWLIGLGLSLFVGAWFGGWAVREASRDKIKVLMQHLVQLQDARGVPSEKRADIGVDGRLYRI